MVIFGKEYFLDNSLKIYSSQSLEKLIVVYSNEEFISFKGIL